MTDHTGKPQVKPESRGAALSPWMFLLDIWHLAHFLPGLVSLLLVDSDRHFKLGLAPRLLAYFDGYFQTCIPRPAGDGGLAVGDGAALFCGPNFPAAFARANPPPLRKKLQSPGGRHTIMSMPGAPEAHGAAGVDLSRTGSSAVFGHGWYLTAAARLLVAALCGAIVGWEREVHKKGAGLRTHILICLGACLFGLVGLRIHQEFPGGDMLRLIQGMIFGVGFLSGGIIFTQGGSVRGLTTAAGLWVLSGAGLAAGLGYYIIAAFATILAFVVTAWMKHVEERLPRGEEPPSALS